MTTPHFGPNDTHFEKNPETGVLEQKPGLGEFEPSEKARKAAAAEAEQYRLREEALARAGADIRTEAAALEERQREFERKEAELAGRIAAFDARSSDQNGAIEKAFVEGALPEEDRRKSATDRPKK